MEVLLLKATNISHTAADELQAARSTDRLSIVLVSDWSQQLTWHPDAREAGGEGKSVRIWQICWVLSLTNHSTGNITKLSTVVVPTSYWLLALLSIFQVLRTNETSVSLPNQWGMASNSVRSEKQDRLASRQCGYFLAHYFKIESNQHFICIYVGSSLCLLY